MTPPGIASMLLGGYLAGVYGVDMVILGAGLLAFVSLVVIWLAFSRGLMTFRERVLD